MYHSITINIWVDLGGCLTLTFDLLRKLEVTSPSPPGGGPGGAGTGKLPDAYVKGQGQTPIQVDPFY